MKNNTVYLFYMKQLNEFAIIIGTGEKSFLFDGCYRFYSSEGGIVVTHPENVVEIGEL